MTHDSPLDPAAPFNEPSSASPAGSKNTVPDANPGGLYAALINASPDGVFVVDLDGCITFASPALLGIFSLCSPEEMVGSRVADWVEESDRARLLLHWRQSLGGDLSWDNVYRFQTRDGRLFMGEVDAAPLREADGRVTGLMGVLRDVTRRWAASEALALSEARFRSVVQSNPAGMHFYHLRPGGRLVLEDANAAADSILGVEHARLLEKTLEEAFPGLADTNIPSAYRWLAAEGGQWRADQISYNRDQISGAFDVTAFQISPGHMVAVFTDITERKVAERALRASLENIQLLRTVDKTIIEHDDVRTSLDALLQPVVSFFHADAAEILLYDPENRCFRQAAGTGFVSALAVCPVGDNEGMPGLAMRMRKPVGISNLRSVLDVIGNADFLVDEGFVSAYSALLVTPARVQGVLQLFYRRESDLPQSTLDFFEMIANQVAIAVEKTSLWENHQRALAELVQAYESTLEGWVMALDLRDNELEHHTRRVTDLTTATAQALGISGAALVHMRWGALLHDIGKIGIPDHILHKQGALSAEEWKLMRQHPVFAMNMLSPIQYLRAATDIPYCHHERWNGSGYPRGLTGEEIPLAARIFALADVWDALTSDRPYRRAWSRAETVAYIKENTGTLFDPSIVPVFLGVLGE